MHYLAKIGSGLLLAAAIAGCHRTVNTVSVGESTGNTFQWVETDHGVSQITRVLSAKKMRTETGLLKVQVELMNVRNHTERFVYKWVWLDAGGMEITSLTNQWQVGVINGKETILLSQIAPDARVTDARLKLQETIR